MYSILLVSKERPILDKTSSSCTELKVSNGRACGNVESECILKASYAPSLE